MQIKPQQFQKKLLHWFDIQGRKHFPWQQNKTPYRVWISEIMLQQTQVNTVLPYYERFMQHFPDLNSLARAPEDQVLHLWAGLGYYSRARNLHRAAQTVVSRYQGKFPSDFKNLLTLPGIGPSTAGAILSIAFNQSATILDGNVKRVLSRLHAISDPINEKEIENKLWTIAESYTPQNRTADYTQAIMDFGATLCTRTKPHCEVCPFSHGCLAYRQNLVAEIPKRKRATTLLVRSATFIILKKHGSILLYKRPSSGIWGGLWSLPEMDGNPSKKILHSFCQQQFNLNKPDYVPLPAFRHTFTHYHLDIFPVLISIKKTPVKCMASAEKIWYNPKTPAQVGLPAPIQSILRKLT